MLEALAAAATLVCRVPSKVAGCSLGMPVFNAIGLGAMALAEHSKVLKCSTVHCNTVQCRIAVQCIRVRCRHGQGSETDHRIGQYRLESRPLIDPRPRILGLDLALTQNRA